MKRYNSAKYACSVVLLLLAPTGCSKSADENTTETGSTLVSNLFAEGFNGEAPENGTEPVRVSDNLEHSEDQLAGIPFDRSRSVTRQVEEATANDLDKLLSLRFALADPADFVRSGKARSVWEREMAVRGYSADTLAGATALMFGVAWEVANERKLSAADNAAILRQIITKLRGDQWERQNDEQRQIQADIRLIAAGLWLEEAYLRETHPDQMRELSDAVQRDMLKMSNNDMRATVVTRDGFSE